MKKFRKVIVALLAMVMALGCLTMTASAAEYTDNGTLYIIGDFTDGWKSDVKLTGVNGVYTYEVELEAGSYLYKFRVAQNWDELQISADGTDFGDPSNFTLTADKDGTYVITLDTSKLTSGSSSKAANGADAVTVTAKTDSNTGVSAPVVAAAIAVVSMVGIVVFAKRRTVAE